MTISTMRNTCKPYFSNKSITLSLQPTCLSESSLQQIGTITSGRSFEFVEPQHLNTLDIPLMKRQFSINSSSSWNISPLISAKTLIKLIKFWNSKLWKIMYYYHWISHSVAVFCFQFASFNHAPNKYPWCTHDYQCENDPVDNKKYFFLIA